MTNGINNLNFCGIQPSAGKVDVDQEKNHKSVPKKADQMTLLYMDLAAGLACIPSNLIVDPISNKLTDWGVIKKKTNSTSQQGMFSKWWEKSTVVFRKRV